MSGAPQAEGPERRTLHALGDLDDAAARAVEQEADASPAVAAELRELRATVARLREALDADAADASSAPRLTAARRAAIRAAVTPARPASLRRALGWFVTPPTRRLRVAAALVVAATIALSAFFGAMGLFGGRLAMQHRVVSSAGDFALDRDFDGLPNGWADAGIEGEYKSDKALQYELTGLVRDAPVDRLARGRSGSTVSEASTPVASLAIAPPPSQPVAPATPPPPPPPAPSRPAGGSQPPADAFREGRVGGRVGDSDSSVAGFETVLTAGDKRRVLSVSGGGNGEGGGGGGDAAEIKRTPPSPDTVRLGLAASGAYAEVPAPVPDKPSPPKPSPPRLSADRRKSTTTEAWAAAGKDVSYIDPDLARGERHAETYKYVPGVRGRVVRGEDRSPAPESVEEPRRQAQAGETDEVEKELGQVAALDGRFEFGFPLSDTKGGQRSPAPPKEVPGESAEGPSVNVWIPSPVVNQPLNGEMGARDVVGADVGGGLVLHEREAEPAPPPPGPACGVNPVVETAVNPFSTFSIDVDTASYTAARRALQQGRLPEPETVRTEEFVNFFGVDREAPAGRTFGVWCEVAPAPFGRGQHLLKIDVKGRRVGREERRGARLTVVLDTSGSMETPDRLGLARHALDLLLARLDPQDQVAVVQFDAQARLRLPHTPAAERERIWATIAALRASGTTHLAEGVRLGYEVAARGFAGDAENRVLLLSDGVANVGEVESREILARVEAYRRQGIRCSVYGFGQSGYNDALLEQLANKGDGVYAFIDSEAEARRIFVDDLAATLHTIASDVKIQVEFDPARVRRHRQLGYENRQLTKEQFRDDSVDAGEIGSGQSVTALYECELHGAVDRPLGMVRVRYRDLRTGRIEEIEAPLVVYPLPTRFESAGPRFRLAAAVAEFSELLRRSPHAAGGSLRAVLDVARPVQAELHLDARVEELLHLVQAAQALAPDW